MTFPQMPHHLKVLESASKPNPCDINNLPWAA
jgi:hypothetical protein